MHHALPSAGGRHELGQIDPRTQMMFVALLNGAGVGMFSGGLSVLFLLCFPLRMGEYWAKWAVPLISFPGGIYVTYIAWQLHERTQASTPWAINAVMLSLGVVGFLLSLGKGRQAA